MKLLPKLLLSCRLIKKNYTLIKSLLILIKVKQKMSRSPSPRSKVKALTFIEVLIAFALVAIFALIAIPSYKYFVQGQRALTLSSEFVTALAYARAAAIQQSTPVTICAANSAMTACGTNTNWTNGWIIFVDPGSTGTIGGTTKILIKTNDLQPGTTFVTTQPYISYSSTGFAAVGAGTYTINAPGCTGNNGKIITISATGMASVANTVCS